MEVVESKRVYEGRVVNLRVDTLRNASGKTHAAEVVEHAQAVVVMVRTGPDTVLLVRQYRHPLGRENWEMVAGGMDPGESVEAAAARELREETGYVAKRVTRLFSGFSAPGFCEELLHFCVVDDYEITDERSPDEGEEEMEWGSFRLDDLLTMILDDRLPDVKTQLMVLWALRARSSS